MSKLRKYNQAHIFCKDVNCQFVVFLGIGLVCYMKICRSLKQQCDSLKLCYEHVIPLFRTFPVPSMSCTVKFLICKMTWKFLYDLGLHCVLNSYPVTLPLPHSVPATSATSLSHEHARQFAQVLLVHLPRFPILFNCKGNFFSYLRYSLKNHFPAKTYSMSYHFYNYNLHLSSLIFIFQYI